jgi:large conductance mechanosensitive channel
MLKEFRDFIIKGNALQLAIGVILAVAFGAVVVALTDGVLMPLIAAAGGQPDTSSLAFEVNGTPIQYGRVVSALINLILVGLVLFLVVKGVNRVFPSMKMSDETDHELLVQIRDSVSQRPLELPSAPSKL